MLCVCGHAWEDHEQPTGGDCDWCPCQFYLDAYLYWWEMTFHGDFTQLVDTK